MTKQCSKCTNRKPVTEFRKNKTKTDGHQDWCKACQKLQYALYYKTQPKEASRVKANSKTRRIVLAEKVLEYLRTHPCITCGESDPVVLEFDHTGTAQKHRSIAEMVSVGSSWCALEREIQKCQVLCANCHRRKTAAELGWFRATRLAPVA